MNFEYNTLVFLPDNGQRITVDFRGKQIKTNLEVQELTDRHHAIIKEICGNDTLYHRSLYTDPPGTTSSFYYNDFKIE